MGKFDLIFYHIPSVIKLRVLFCSHSKCAEIWTSLQPFLFSVCSHSDQAMIWEGAVSRSTWKTPSAPGHSRATVPPRRGTPPELFPAWSIFRRYWKRNSCYKRLFNLHNDLMLTLTFQMILSSWKTDSDGFGWRPTTVDLLRRSICLVICGKTGWCWDCVASEKGRYGMSYDRTIVLEIFTTNLQ